ncbi:MAG TPA: tetratricopeptide repeat-containing glycosyltransferase family protein [Bryobacteraceae bacterium]|jgi:tetratricopeptide (TPR) repeat protein
MYPFLRRPKPVPTLRDLLNACRNDPRDAEAASRLGNALHHQEQPKRALQYIQKAIRLAPRNGEHLYTQARILLEQERLEEAANSYERALALDPSRADWCCELGKLYIKRLGKTEQALELFLRAIAADPTNHFGFVGIGRCAIQGRDGGKARAYARSLAPAADPLDVDRGVARALEHYGRYCEALECRLEILCAAPEDLKTLNALGRINDALGDRASAMRHHERAFGLNPRHGESFFYYLFKLREFDRASEVYWAAKPELRHFAGAGRPCWEGSAWRGLTVLLDSVGGYGDSVQFARFAALLRQQGARVVFQCQKGFCSLASSVPGIDLAVAKHDERPEVDYELVLFLETYQILGFAIEEALGQVPYLQPTQSRRAKWSARLAEFSDLKVGICWAGTGSNLHNPYAFRSIPLAQWKPLLDVPGVSFIGLQKGPVLREVARASEAVPVQNIGDEFSDFEDAAAAMLACDLVVSVDTSIAHLAGALGKPVFLFVPYRPCYRWFLEGEETFWYPGMKLFRQARPGEWTSAISRAAQGLREFGQIRRAGASACAE